MNTKELFKQKKTADTADTTEKAKSNTSSRPKTTKRTMVLVIITYTIIFIGIIGLIGSLIFANKLLDGKPEFDENELKSPNSSVIYDANGNKVIELGTYLRENIDYEEMPTCLVDAFLAIEDSRFFEHFGFDIPRFTMAIIANLKNGDFGQGGSTMTMQLIKNSYFQVDANEESTMADRQGLSGVARKMQEIVLAIEAEQQVSKEELFALFVNKINFGNNIRGVEKAAEYYFGKNCSELNLSESAFLAGLINSPNSYNPYNNLYKSEDNTSDYLAKGTNRRNEVLDLMVYHGYITKEEADLAKAIKLEDLLVGIHSSFSAESLYYQSYIDAVIDEAINTTGKDPYITSMQIYSNMDPYMQKLSYDIQNGNTSIKFPNDECQNAIVVMNNQTGAIIALGGGRGQSGSRMFNRATSAYLQPGSAIKPIFEYALAIEELGWSTSYTVTDRPIYLYGSKVLIANAGGQGYTGDMLLTEAVARSLNTPAIQALQEVVKAKGEDFCVNYLNSIGFKVKRENFDLQWAIGGSSMLVTPVQLASAHAMLMNEGNYISGHTINRIVYADDSEYVADTNGTKVLSSAAAYLTAYLEAYNVSGEFFNYMQILKRNYPVYAKTGTTDWGSSGRGYGIPSGSIKDMWMVAQTSDYTVTTWLGFDKLDKGTYFTARQDAMNTKGQICKMLLDNIEDHYDYQGHALEKPDDVVSITHIKGMYPYCYPTEGESVTGLVKKEYSELVDVNSIEKEVIVGELLGMDGSYNPENGELTIRWSGFGSYSDGQQDLSATNLFGDTTTATGRCFYQRYIYQNPGEYFCDLIVDGVLKGTLTSYEPWTTDWPIYGDRIEICGWTSASSKRVCKVIK